MTVAEMLDRMSSRELSEHEAYYILKAEFEEKALEEAKRKAKS